MNILAFCLPALMAALGSFLLTPLVRRIAIRVHAIDVPDARKVHRQPIPRMGGLAVVLSAAAVIAGAFLGRGPVNPWMPANLSAGIGLGVLPILFVSLWDDIRPLRALPKLLGHFAGAAIAISCGVALGSSIHLFGRAIELGPWSTLVSIIWIVGVTNAFNIVDGLDGLSAGLALISAGCLTAVFLLTGQTGMARASLTLAGGLVGFLPYNVYPARIFLGDSGAAAVGFCLACFSLRGGSTLSAGFATLLPVFVLGLPVAETLISIARRVVRRLEHEGSGGVFEADRDHIHHRLLALGIDHRRAVLILYGVGLILGGAGLLSVLMTVREAGWLLVALLVAGFVGVARLGYDEFAVIRRGVVLRFYEAPVLKRSLFVVFVDLAMVAASAYAAVGLKFDDWGLLEHRPEAAAMLAVLAPVTVVLFWLFGLYRGSWRLAGVDDFLRASTSVASSVLAAWAIATVAFPRLPGSLLFIQGLLMLVFLNGSRASYRVLLNHSRRQARTGSPTVIYGAGLGGASALREILSNEALGLRPIGFLDDDEDREGRLVNGYPVFGPLEKVEAMTARFPGLTVIVSSQKIAKDRLKLAEELCLRRGVRLLQMEIRFGGVDGGVPPADVSRPRLALVKVDGTS